MNILLSLRRQEQYYTAFLGGFTAVSGGNKMTVLYAGEAGAAQYQVVLWCNGDATIEASDAEVLAILESIKPAA